MPFEPVYALHLRLPEPGLHANPWTQTPPLFHIEGLHTIQWLMSNRKQLTKTVKGDGLRFALRDHDSGKFIPHLPYPPSAGPFLLETHLNSKYQVIFHQPNVELDGSPVGIFQWLLAPPWRCFEVKLPLPKFLAKHGRAAALRQSKQELRESLVEVGDRIREARAAETAALARKAERDQFVRRGLQSAARHEAEASAQQERASNALGKQRADALAAAARQRSEAAAARSGAAAWAEEARRHAGDARAHRSSADAARQERARQEKHAQAVAQQRGPRKPENPPPAATGAGTASVACPSLFAHVPFPATVQFHVSWTQLAKTWGRALVNLARELLSAYVGFIFDGVLAPGRSKPAVWALDLAKSVCSDTLIGGAQKLLMEGEFSAKVSQKLGPVKVSARVEWDSKSGKWIWKTCADASGKLQLGAEVEAEGQLWHGPEKLRLNVGGEPVREWSVPKPPVVYSHGTPELE